jgi:ABC-type bacteriocin/lantibiotic exporter with double-glycine peptidase domain
LFPSVIATKPCYNRIQKFLLAAKMEDSHRAFDNSGDWVFGDKHTMQDFSLIKATNLRLDVPFLTEGTPINFTICPGAVWMLSGPVGSGKSTMLKAILGETNLQEGTIELQSNLIGYCAQTPWLQNRSIKENIIGTNIEDEAWYRHVLYTCDLDQDISQMPDGHNTQVGNRGISISGGQKHRIVGHTQTMIRLRSFQQALARALYSRCALLVLDDLFSALDRRTQTVVAKRLFSADGHVKKYSCGVLFATHSGSSSITAKSTHPFG